MTETSTSSKAGTHADAIPPGYEAIPHSVVRLRAKRKAIARNLEQSSQIPSLTADMQMDLTRLLGVREEYNSQSEPAERLSVLAFLARAAVSALEGFPAMNATYVGSAVLLWHQINLGIAVDAPGGLVVPVISDAQTMGVTELGTRIRTLAELARTGDLTVDNLTGGTFTVSNPGSVGPVLRAEALINPPQVALLGFPSAKRLPVIVGDEESETLAIRTVVCPSLTFDHRALDGAEVIRFLDAMRQRVERWQLDDYRTPAVVETVEPS